MNTQEDEKVNDNIFDTTGVSGESEIPKTK